MIKRDGIFSKSLSTLIIKVLGAAFAFVSATLVTRNFGQENAGIYFLVLSIAYLLWPLSSLGLNNAALKEVSKYYASSKLVNVYQCLSVSSILVATASLLTCLLLYFLSDSIALYVFDDINLAVPLKLVSFSLPFYCLYNLNSVVIQSYGKVVYSMIIISLVIPTSMSILIISGLIGSLNDLLFGYLFASVLCYILSLIAFFPVRELLFKGVEFKETARNLLALSIPMMVSQLVMQGNAQLSNIVLGVLSSVSDVAMFGVCIKIATLVSFVLTSVNRVIAPRFSVLHSQGNLDELQLTVIKATRLMIIVSIIPLLGLFLFGDYVLSIFGSEYARGLNVLRILILGQFFNVFAGSVGYLLQMTGNQKLLRNNVMVSFVIGALLSWPLIMYFGVYGAAWTTFTIVCLSNFLSWRAVKVNLGINTLIYNKV